MRSPYFSVIITTFNRANSVKRCIKSCLHQTYKDYELIVIDDGSIDETVELLQGQGDSRLRIIVHESNRGINPSRNTGVREARGEWIVVLDSDWELLPHALQVLHDISNSLPHHVRVIQGRLLWDDGHISPSFVPPFPVSYEARIRWVEEQGSDDSVPCIHHSVFESTPYFSDRRGAMETLFELDLAQRETIAYIEEVVGMEHTDAPNSYVRSVDRNELVPRLLRDAPDMLWMAETALQKHGRALRMHGPSQYWTLVRVATVSAFLAADRRKGLRYGRRYLGVRRLDPFPWVTLVLGVVGPRALAHGALAHRMLKARFIYR